MDRATVTFRVSGTTRHKLITGPRISVQMGPDSTVVQVSGPDPGAVTRVHMFRNAEYVDIERGGGDG